MYPNASHISEKPEIQDIIPFESSVVTDLRLELESEIHNLRNEVSTLKLLREKDAINIEKLKSTIQSSRKTERIMLKLEVVDYNALSIPMSMSSSSSSSSSALCVKPSKKLKQGGVFGLRWILK